jgi:hypothetical protein
MTIHLALSFSFSSFNDSSWLGAARSASAFFNASILAGVISQSVRRKTGL